MTGFVDLQVNGYAGVDLNADEISDEAIVDVCVRLKADGVDKILATIITAPIEAMRSRIRRIAVAIDSFSEVSAVIAGIHVEGPFISPVDGYVGAHPKDAVMKADVETASRLVEAGGGHVRLLTLAPEMDLNAVVTRHLTEQGIVVAGGHSDASGDQLDAAIDSGLTLYTHLGNGCPAMLPRHDNIIQRVLARSDRVSVSLIADGHHVPDFALRNYLQCIPDDRVIIVTDAIGAAGLGPGQYTLGDQTVHVDSDGAAWAADRRHFAGCATTMPTMAKILLDRVGANPEQIDRWTRQNPITLLG
ncbi:N-acetylglucosamine-6-phosphate deacetylase [Rubripirellula reticaptiva]|uniref:N-acetylglucosamine-6-phosphate deacetylase n=1 Tax=Rubripirellula reticaptiva TaxID=2528013 RepID=A0A5C6F8T3_9BACT|nr:N-acetylglucosamine-6-phosphate deacetylase [Rubripirellula reticaptiva]TWU57808.1 N-acetylglucosamine-6-phosphate deacetylase [Rubripirellula reticaptiva]